ncbi:hypothetical protein [Proteus mirabilis]|uniref:hypothetical protein n=3 Tax=Proteus mirabilis TaxID=584 RepID=UPI000ACA5853|nr:hypothetical protein [Proteus mirabilis]AZG99146.1 hypothetical protein EHQ66_11510 [Proteus mirabilis]ELO7513872.1 hypothetical protein [Proteus mirabilis]MBG3155036.1 hypothetical protein [Proteus mirabilis]MBN4015255.1 hypothetical protein [Proteus mirabilis]MBN4028202.1 hypothetical protein [Proteus mirabilis]
MRKILVTSIGVLSSLSILFSASSMAKENIKISDVAKAACVNHKDKESCEGLIIASMGHAFDQGRISMVCDLMRESGDKIPEEQKDRCDEANEMLLDVRSVKY